MSTTFVKPADAKREWLLIDAEKQVLGRLAARIARILLGKGKPTYVSHQACGDYVVVVNAGKVRVTGKKLDVKFYFTHSGYPGGMKKVILRTQLEKHPDRVIKAAVWGMLPHGRLGRRMFKKLKVYAAPTHPHVAHKPKKLEV